MSKQLGKSLLRSAKNYTKGYSDMQIKVRQATSNDPWGPSGSLMAEISQSSYNHRDFLEIMEMIDKRLNDHGKNWRHVFKALTLLDYLLHTGSEAVIAYARENLYVIKTLKEFQYIDDDGKDQGANVRQKCKDITALLADESRLREARQTRADMRGRMTEGSGPAAAASGSAGGNGTYYNEDRELQKALEESRKTAQTDESRRKAMTQEELDVQKALELSEKEAIERRMRERDEAVKNEKKDDNIIDFFGGLEDTTPANPYGQQPQQQQQQGGGYDPFAGFGGNDVFAQQQQQYQQQYMMQQQQQQQLQQQLAQQQALQQQQMQNQMFNQAQQSNPFGGTPFGQASNAGQQQQQIPEGSDALARGSGPIDPFASLAASRTSQNTGSGSVSGSTQFNPFGGSSSGTQSSALPMHSTGGGFGGNLTPQQALSVNNTGGGFGGVASHSTGGFGNVTSHSTGGFGITSHSTGGFQPLSQNNTGGGFFPQHNTGGGYPSQHQTGGAAGFLSQHNTGGGFGTPGGRNTTDLVNLDASSLAKGSNNAFSSPAAAKNPFQTGTPNNNKFQWESPKPAQPTLSQLAGQNAFNATGGGSNNAFNPRTTPGMNQPGAFGSTSNPATPFGGAAGMGMGMQNTGGANPFGMNMQQQQQPGGFNPQQQQQPLQQQQQPFGQQQQQFPQQQNTAFGNPQAQQQGSFF